MTMADEYPHAAAGFLYDAESTAILLHHRPGFTENDPYRWTFFSGRTHGDEDPRDCFIRMLKDEAGIYVFPNDVLPLCEYFNEELLIHRHTYYVERKKDAVVESGEAHVEYAWVPLDRVFALDLTEKTRRDIKYFLEKINIT